jgi:hypothetical protein
MVLGCGIHSFDVTHMIYYFIISLGDPFLDIICSNDNDIWCYIIGGIFVKWKTRLFQMTLVKNSTPRLSCRDPLV